MPESIGVSLAKISKLLFIFTALMVIKKKLVEMPNFSARFCFSKGAKNGNVK